MSMCLGCSASQEHLPVGAIPVAIIAVAHSLVIIGYYLQKNQRNYEDLGGDYFHRIDPDGLKRYLITRLEKLGHKVTLVPIKAA
jgi:transposase